MKGNWRRKLRITGKKSLRGDQVKASISGLTNGLCSPNASCPFYSPKEVQEPKHLHQHPHEGPSTEHEDHPRKKADAPSNLLFPRKEIKGLLGANEEGDA